MRRPLPARKGTPRLKFMAETIAELKKVIWPSREEIVRLTSVVLVVILIVGLILGVVDFGFSRLLEIILTAL